jgi:hypothetical protein
MTLMTLITIVILITLTIIIKSTSMNLYLISLVINYTANKMLKYPFIDSIIHHYFIKLKKNMNTWSIKNIFVWCHWQTFCIRLYCFPMVHPKLRSFRYLQYMTFIYLDIRFKLCNVHFWLESDLSPWKWFFIRRKREIFISKFSWHHKVDSDNKSSIINHLSSICKR